MLAMMNKIGQAELHNIDCMAYMATLPDKAFDLAIVDPPYGINHSVIAGEQAGKKYRSTAAAKGNYALKDWDKSIPDESYFNELRRVSKNQIIWGANYMTLYLPSSMGWIVWDKDNASSVFSDCELAYTSFDRGLKKFTFTWNGMIQGDMKNKEIRIHPTQKPVKLYEWILTNYAEQGQKILDTHLGSGSIAIACNNLGFNLVGCELDEDYYKAACDRVNKATAQERMFA
jgi:site-specific DNA-methyltransferase (adenine-specific)